MDNNKKLALTLDQELEGFDDSDDTEQESEDEDEEDSDLDSEDEEKALMAELAAIKKEKAMQRAKEEAEEQRKRELEEERAMKDGNPLIGSKSKAKSSGSFTLKRSWTEDTVFKN